MYNKSLPPSKWQRGIDYIQKGCDAHESGDTNKAASLYEKGIQLLIEYTKNLPQSERKNEKQTQINSYLTLLADLRPNQNQFNSNNKNNQNKKKFMRQSSLPINKNNNHKYNRKPKQKRPSKSAHSNFNQNIYKKHSNNANQNRKKKPNRKNKNEFYSIIENEIIDTNLKVRFSDVIGLETVKQALLESVILPSKRPDIFVGPRTPPRGLLLFGPPGNGKTFIAKALASECNSTFFCISSANLTSKYVGDGEKLVSALFECARDNAPSIIFIDEIDSLLTKRGNKNEQESSRRMKTQFLIEMDGACNSETQVLMIGATNLPWELDDAALRRFAKRILVPKPDFRQRFAIIRKIIFEQIRNELSKSDFEKIANLTNGYSASDLKNLCNDASMGPIRDCGMSILNDHFKQIPSVKLNHFMDSINNIQPSTGAKTVQKFDKWNEQFGSNIKMSKKGNHHNNNNNDSGSSSGWLSNFSLF